MIDPTSSKKRKVNRRPRAVRPGQQLLTLAQAEAETGVPYWTLRDLGLRGHLPIVRLPGIAGEHQRRWWIRRADLEELIARSVEPVAV